MRQYGWQGGRWRGETKSPEEGRPGAGQGCQSPAEGQEDEGSGDAKITIRPARCL